MLGGYGFIRLDRVAGAVLEQFFGVHVQYQTGSVDVCDVSVLLRVAGCEKKRHPKVPFELVGE